MKIKIHPTWTTTLYVSQFHLRPAPSPPRADPRELAFFLPWMANSRWWGLLSWQIPRGGEEKRGQMPCHPSTVQHFLLIAQSNSAILKCDFFVSINVFLCNSARILLKTSRRDDMHQFMVLVLASIDIKLLTLKLIERCKVICYE